MMSAIETGISGYRPAQLLNWVYMSLQDSQEVAYDASGAESDTSPLDANVSKRSAADLNYLNKFFHLRSEVQFQAVTHMQDNVQREKENSYFFPNTFTNFWLMLPVL